MIYSENSREVDGYQKLIKKISSEVKKGNAAEVTAAIDESFQSSEEFIPGSTWLNMQSKINMKKATK